MADLPNEEQIKEAMQRANADQRETVAKADAIKSKSVDTETGEQIFTQCMDALSKFYGTKKIIATIYIEPETVAPNEAGDMPCLHLVTVGDPSINYDRYAGKILSLQGQIWNNMQLNLARQKLAEQKAKEQAEDAEENSESEAA